MLAEHSLYDSKNDLQFNTKTYFIPIEYKGRNKTQKRGMNGCRYRCEMKIIEEYWHMSV